MSELYQLPDGWEWKRLVEVCEKITDGAHQSPKTIDKGKPYITVRDIQGNGQIDFDGCKFISNEDFELLVKNNCKPNKGDVLLSKDGTVGKVSLVKDSTAFVVLSSLAILSPSNNLLPEFLKNYLLSPYFVEAALNSKTGAAIKRIVLKAIKEFYIPVPPLEEQKRIVQKLDALFERIDKAIALLQKNIDAADNFMNSVLNDVFSDLEQNYKKVQLSEIVSKLGDGLHGTPKYDGSGEYYFINGANIKDVGIVVNENTKKVNVEEYQKYKKELNDRTILISINGTIGNVGIYNNEMCILGKSACYFNLLDGIDKIYITYVIRSVSFQEYIRNNATGATIKNVSLKTMRESKLIVPPLKIQQKVVAYLDNISAQIEQVKSSQQQKMQNLLDLKSSILDQAFHGKL